MITAILRIKKPIPYLYYTSPKNAGKNRIPPALRLRATLKNKLDKNTYIMVVMAYE